MHFGLDAGQLGLLRSLLMYYAIPFRSRQLARFYAQFIQAGDLCFDIGAHVGNQLRVWSRLGARVVGVEPQPACMRFLKLCYGRHPSITLVEQAVGAVPGTQALHVSQRTPTVSSLSREWIDTVQRIESFAWVRWDASVSVSVTTLDRLIAEYGRPAFCKIDVEGYELEVLRGLSQPLPALSFEYIPAALETALGCIARLGELGAYAFNWKPAALGESYRLQSASWLSPDAMAAQLKSLPPDGASGDVYARLRT